MITMKTMKPVKVLRDFPIHNGHWTRHSILRWSLATERENYTEKEQKEITSRLKESARVFNIRLPDTMIWRNK
jgi:hypothetical protein